jgi:hypothetical protein
MLIERVTFLNNRISGIGNAIYAFPYYGYGKFSLELYILIISESTTVVIKNSIFEGNSNYGDLIALGSSVTFTYDYNYFLKVIIFLG